MSLSSSQRTKLMTLWTQYVRRSLDVVSSCRVFAAENERLQRLAFVGQVIGRTITSCNELTGLEAISAISALNEALGQPAHQRRSRDRAQAAGTHGRRDNSGRSAELASTEDHARIQNALDRLGWTAQRYEKFLASKNSPLKGKGKIQTVGDANKVWWVLKKFLKLEGKWEEQQ